jgi:hypothetical protein
LETELRQSGHFLIFAICHPLSLINPCPKQPARGTLLANRMHHGSLARNGYFTNYIA